MAKKCSYPKCKEWAIIKKTKCHFHKEKATVSSFLSGLYRSMLRRTRGKGTKRPDLYVGKSIMSKEVFFSWSRNHPHFLKLYKEWVTSDFDRRLTPTLNRVNSTRGYSLDNVEWMTNSQNCGLSGSVRRLKAKKEIYNLLGVKNG